MQRFCCLKVARNSLDTGWEVRKGSAMTGKDPFHLEILDHPMAGLKGCPVCHQAVQSRLAPVRIKISAKQVAPGSKDPYGTTGVSGQADDFGVEAVCPQVIPMLQKEGRSESLRGEQRFCQPSEHPAGYPASSQHITSSDHVSIAHVHGNRNAISLHQPGGVPGVIKVAMGQDDEMDPGQITRKAQQFPFQDLPVFSCSVNEYETGVCFNEVAIGG